MAKLTKAQIKVHEQACALLEKEILTEDDKYFVLDNWQESATHVNSKDGAFFTPTGLARDAMLGIEEGKIIDLCAGIGALAFQVVQSNKWTNRPLELVCVEKNPDYVAVGKKIVPEAAWICGDVLEVDGQFDIAISNPPFGGFEFKVIEVASRIADYGVFIVPQMSAGFNYSGKPYYERHTSGKAFEFQKKTGLRFESAISVDTTYYLKDWKGVAPVCEVVGIYFKNNDE